MKNKNNCEIKKFRLYAPLSTAEGIGDDVCTGITISVMLSVTTNFLTVLLTESFNYDDHNHRIMLKYQPRLNYKPF